MQFFRRRASCSKCPLYGYNLELPISLLAPKDWRWISPDTISLSCLSFRSNDVDVIVFTVHEHGYKQCSDDPVGTYITPVPNFMEGYMKYYSQIQQDKGNDDYELPEASEYAYCTRTVKNNNEYWIQMGCSDVSTKSLAVNIYSDNTCTTRSSKGGSDDANIDVSDLQVSWCCTAR